MASPTTLTITNNAATSGEVRIAGTSAGRDAAFYSYRLYMREQGFADWVEVYQTFAVDANYFYDAYIFSANKTTEVAVVEVTNNVQTGLTLGAFNVASFSTNGISNYYFINGADSTKNFFLQHATGHSVTEEWEEGVFTLIGRGRKVDRGTRLGEAGSISATLFPTATRTVRDQWRELRDLRETDDEIFVRPPFGDITKIAVTGLSHERVPGVGPEDYMTVTIDYVEVA